MPNPIWSGAVTFGLVSIPVRLYPATENKDVHFHLLHRHDNARIVQRYYCPEDGELVEWYDLVRGYEVSRGRYVALTEEDFAAVPINSLHAIDIDLFVKLDDIDPIHFTRTYYLAPEELGAKPFALLMTAMKESGKVAIGKFTLRNKEHVCVLRPYRNTLALSPLLYRDEVRSTENLRAPAAEEIDEETLAVAKQYIEALTTEFDHAAYSDNYRENLLALINEKAEVLRPVERTRVSSTLPDLMEALRTAVDQAAKKRSTGRRRAPVRV